VKPKPGPLPTFFAILGIVVYGLGSLISYSLLSIQITEFSTLGEDLGGLLVSIIFILILYGLGILGSVFVILGSIWKQRKLLVVFSLITYLGTIAPILILSIWSADIGNISIEFIITWSVMTLILFMHFYGLASRFEVTEKRKHAN
jgi:hypothetical protein